MKTPEEKLVEMFAKAADSAGGVVVPLGGKGLTSEQLQAKCRCGHPVSRHRTTGCQPRVSGASMSVCCCSLTREEAWESKKRRAP